MSENYIIIVCMHVLSTELCGMVPVLKLLLRDGYEAAALNWKHL